MSEHDREACSDVLRGTASTGLGPHSVEIDVHGERPAPISGYQPEPFTCPHGFTYWVLPSVRQISAWEGTS